MASMRAAVLKDSPGELEILELAIDQPGPHEVLITTAAAGLCHSDLHFIDGSYSLAEPAVLGHESAGVVEAVGSEVSYVEAGDHVVTCVSAFCGHCDYCLTGRPYLCMSPELRRAAPSAPRLLYEGKGIDQFAGLGSFAEQMLVHEHAVVKITPDMPLDRAALIGCGVLTGLGAVFHTASLRPGATAAVIGCGGVGLSCVQGARLAGASRIIAIDPLPAKRALALSLGATDEVDPSGRDPVEAVIELTSGGVEHAFEAIGSATTAEQAFGMVRRGGTATVIGMIPLGQSVQIPGVALLSKTLQGSIMGSNRFRIDVPRYVDLYLQGRLRLDEMVTARITLDEVNEGFAALAAGDAVRSVISFDA